jgi:hypothetical protein
VLDIIRAEGGFGSGFVESKELSSGRGTLEFVAEVPEVFRADLESQHFIDHRCEVRQRPNRSEGQRIGWSRRTPRSGEYQCVLDGRQRHAAVMQLSRKRTIRTSNYACCAGRCAIRFENMPHILALLHPTAILSPAARAATDR